ncbi:thiamine pyrophosphate-binding protein [Xanthobacter autotrophicus DSM 431]|uniref:thiamine pyrophosphate-binding protein n=1 Tax=Xanthobacter nonsaccharivorans TaxID=3119912 RepID=UPI00372C804F
MDAPNTTTHRVSGGQLLVDVLVAEGVSRVFCVPGESYLAVLDALHDAPGVDVVVARQEGGAAMMAEADAKLTGQPGICMVTRGPGATNASAGVHIAFQDSTPLILFIGQIAGDAMGRDGFQEIDYRHMFGPLAKWVVQIDDAARIPELVSRAFHVATSGRPGPVVVALPEDMLTDLVEAPVTPVPRHRKLEAAPAASAMEEMHRRVDVATAPLMIVGGPGWDDDARRRIVAYAQSRGLPIVASFRRQDVVDNDLPNYVGELGLGANPALLDLVRRSDLLLVVGARLGEVPTAGYTLLGIPSPDPYFIHVHASVDELGRVYCPDLPINAPSRAFAAALEDAPSATPDAGRLERLRAARAAYEAWQVLPVTPGDLKMADVMRTLAAQLPDDAIICNGAGNYTVWIHRFHRYRRPRTQLAPTSGSMGYGLPAGVAAKLREPDRAVVVFAGDGCFQMTMQEFGTAVQYGAAIVVIVVNNGMYGTIRMHQERHYPGRVVATDLKNPDFAALARSYGAHGEVVERPDAFGLALGRALAADGPALIELRIDPEALTPNATLAQIRAAAERSKASR